MPNPTPEALVEQIIDRAARESCMDGMDGDRWDRILVRTALASREPADHDCANPSGPCYHPSHDKEKPKAAPGAVEEAVRLLNESGYHDAADALASQPVAIDRDRALASARFRAACYALVSLVEGPGCLRWADGNGYRLKDTAEWARFYVAVKAMQERGEPDALIDSAGGEGEG